MQQDTDTFVRLGGWLFQRRTWLPLPLAVLLLALPPSGPDSRIWAVGGVACLAIGEAIRLWAVRHIGAISRTRSDRLGPVVATGPFGIVRNPLYLGNIALWVGFAITARLMWLVPIVILLLAFEYHAIVRWEETLLEARRGDEYRAYRARVPRWFPSSGRQPAIGHPPAVAFSWRDTIFSERGTLIAIAVGLVLLLIKREVAWGW
jgi:protein-S-isoprenylcysteine O-methyltransferase Ste14